MKIKYIGKRDMLNFYELDEKNQTLARKEYGDGCEDQSFYFNEHNELELFEFLRIDQTDTLSSFHGYKSDSAFSGSLVILNPENGYAEKFKLFTFYT